MTLAILILANSTAANTLYRFISSHDYKFKHEKIYYFNYARYICNAEMLISCINLLIRLPVLVLLKNVAILFVIKHCAALLCFSLSAVVTPLDFI